MISAIEGLTHRLVLRPPPSVSPEEIAREITDLVRAYIQVRQAPHIVTVCYHGAMTKNLTVRLDEELAADTEALARAEGMSLNETVKQALAEAVERRRRDPKFKARIQRIIKEDRELLERLAK